MKLRVVEDRTQSMQDSESASNKVSKTREVRSGKLIFISLACLCLIFAVLGSYLQLWNLPQRLLLTIMPPKESSIIPNSRLIFDDEFNGTSLDTSKWKIEDMSINGYHNCCLNYGKQFFSPQDLSVLDGYLRITTNKQTIEGYAYTSGAITTEDKLSFTYGRVDIRAKLPKTQGFWPAFWLLSDHTKGVSPFEIDMMEMLGKDPTTVHMANHWRTQQNTQNYSGPDFSQDYHVFSMIWTRQAINWYIDGVQRFQSEQNIPNTSMYLIINSSLGGRWAGNPDASTVFPQYLNIDYVRIYQPN